MPATLIGGGLSESWNVCGGRSLRRRSNQTLRPSDSEWLALGVYLHSYQVGGKKTLFLARER
jgi:hypothetical protein